MLSQRRALTTRACRSDARRGFTLAELVLVLALSVVVLGLISSIGTRLQRQLAAETTRLSVGEQLAAAAELLPLELRSLSPLAGDIVEARDTSLQFRSALGSGVVCSATGATLVLAPFLVAGGGTVSLPALSGDTLWLSELDDSTERWLPIPLVGMRRVSGSCPALNASSARVFDLVHLAAADLRAPLAAAAGAVLRLTRPVRYSFYRATDGRWYLGMRSWNVATSQFNTIQPVSGPYAPGGSGAHFEYFDTSGALLPLGSDLTRIARVEVVLQGPPAAATGSASGDSARTATALRNRP
ncbi:MAG: prepilin-type N-terminal cleavage/methylation domain-containing protein [Gemmatimonadaceae bacterium]